MSIWLKPCDHSPSIKCHPHGQLTENLSTMAKCSRFSHYLEAKWWFYFSVSPQAGWEVRASICCFFLSHSPPKKSQGATSRPSISILQHNEQSKTNCLAHAEPLASESHLGQFTAIPVFCSEPSHPHLQPPRLRAWKLFATSNHIFNSYKNLGCSSRGLHIC